MADVRVAEIGKIIQAFSLKHNFGVDFLRYV